MDEREDLIQAINKIREEMGLEPYDVSSLREMDDEELERLYRRSLTLKGTKKTEKPKLNLKILTMVGVFAMISLVAGFIFVKQKIIPSDQPVATAFKADLNDTTTTVPPVTTSTVTTTTSSPTTSITSTTTTVLGTTTTEQTTTAVTGETTTTIGDGCPCDIDPDYCDPNCLCDFLCGLL